MSPAARLDAPLSLPGQAVLAADSNTSPREYRDKTWAGVEDIDTTRWDKLYPYQLLVVESVPGDGGTTQYQVRPGWQFTLPMPPESMVVDTTFAVAESALNSGVLEEWNGVVWKTIHMHGTTGVLPLRGAAEQQTGFNPAVSIFGGTVQAAGNVVSAANQLRESVTGQPQQNRNIHQLSEFEPGTQLGKSTGYYQIRLLERFLHTYAKAKTRRESRSWHLALAVWKDEAVYLVTPKSFRITKSGPQAPLEYVYDLLLRASKRVVLDAGGSGIADLPLPARRDPGVLARALNTVRDATRVVQSASLVATAALGDVDRLITEPCREVALFCRAATSGARTVADFPRALQLQLKASIVQASRDLRWAEATATTRDPVLRRRRAAVTAGSTDFDPAWFGDLSLDELAVSPQLQARLDAEAQRVSALTRDDFADRRDRLRAAADLLATSLGAGDDTFTATTGITAPSQKPAPGDGDWEVLFALNDAATAADHLAATAEPPARGTGMEAMAALARRSGIAFRIPRSKFAVPFPYRGTLEGLAAQYLGDPDRWMEIAELNGLRDPWVDETGWSTPLRTNAVGDEVVAAVGSMPDVYVNQQVWVRSTTLRRVRRIVEGVRVVGADVVLKLDDTVDGYNVKDSAVLEGFLPDTVNSQQLVYIPSDVEPSDDDAVTKAIPGVREFDPYVAVGGVDLLLDEGTNDLIITPDGDCRLAVGLTNTIQGWRIALATPQGKLNRHPQYGRPQVVGESTADVDAGEELRAVRRMFSEDPAVGSIVGVKVEKSGPVNKISASVVVRGIAQPIPVTYHVAAGFKPPEPPLA